MTGSNGQHSPQPTPTPPPSKPPIGQHFAALIEHCDQVLFTDENNPAGKPVNLTYPPVADWIERAWRTLHQQRMDFIRRSHQSSQPQKDQTQ